MRATKKFAAAIAGVTLLALVAACGSGGGGQESKDDTVRFGMPGLPASLDPRLAGENDTGYLEQVYERLITTTEDGQFEPGLATEWSLDGDQFTMTLEEGVTFQDGATFDGEAVKANIEAAQADGSNLKNSLAVIDAVEVSGPTEVTLKLNGPGGHLPGVFASFAGMMISPDALDSDLKSNPVGSGPFTLETLSKEKVVFKKWPDYRDADSIDIDAIEFMSFLDTSTMLRALRSGQINAASLAPQQAKEAEDADLDVTAPLMTKFSGVLLNTAHPELAKPEVRQAIMHAIDRDGIVEANYDGQAAPTIQPYPEGYWAHSDDLAGATEEMYDLDKAKDLMAQAGLEDGFDMEIATIAAPLYQSISQSVQSQLAKIGIRVEIKTATTLVKVRLSGEFDAIVGSFQSGVPDPSVFVADYYSSEGRLNHGDLKFPGVNELLKESRMSVDVEQRGETLREIVANVLEVGPPVIPIAMHNRVLAVDPKMKGLKQTMLADLDFTEVTLG